MHILVVLPCHAGSIVNDRQVGDIVEDRRDTRLAVRGLAPAGGSGSTRHISVIHVRRSGYDSNHHLMYINIFYSRWQAGWSDGCCVECQRLWQPDETNVTIPLGWIPLGVGHLVKGGDLNPVGFIFRGHIVGSN